MSMRCVQYIIRQFILKSAHSPRAKLTEAINNVVHAHALRSGRVKDVSQLGGESGGEGSGMHHTKSGCKSLVCTGRLQEGRSRRGEAGQILCCACVRGIDDV